MDNSLEVRRRLSTSVQGALVATLLMISSIASGEGTEKRNEVTSLSESLALGINSAQQEIDYSSVAGKRKRHLRLLDGKTFKEYLAECRSLIRDGTIEQRARGEQCYKEKLEWLIDSSNSYTENNNADKKN